MTKLFGLTLILMSCVTSFAAQIKTTVLQDLSAYEPFTAHAFHADHLWVASNRENLGAAYQLSVYNAVGNKVATKALNHSMRYLYPYGPNAVLTVGVSVEDQMTHFSIITLKNGKLTLQAWKVPLGAYATEWAGAKGGLQYFTDPGGLDDGSPMGTPLKTIFSTNGARFTYLKPRLPGPRHPVTAKGNIYVIEYPSMTAGRYVDRIDPNQDRPIRLYTGTALANMITLNDGAVLAIADRGTDEVVLIDTATAKVLQKITIAGKQPRGMAVLGSCLVVGSEMTKKLAFFNWREGKQVAQWDLSGVGEKLYGIREVAADSTTGNVYVRSAYAASPLEHIVDRNSVVMAQDESNEIKTLCK